jgi:hypothetical protein
VDRRETDAGTPDGPLVEVAQEEVDEWVKSGGADDNRQENGGKAKK